MQPQLPLFASQNIPLNEGDIFLCESIMFFYFFDKEVFKFSFEI